jgi:hypothetical protein
MSRFARGFFSGALAIGGFARPDFLDALSNRHFEYLRCLGRVVEIGQRHARQSATDGLLDRAHITFFLG